jgi:hypothetical protein
MRKLGWILAILGFSAAFLDILNGANTATASERGLFVLAISVSAAALVITVVLSAIDTMEQSCYNEHIVEGVTEKECAENTPVPIPDVDFNLRHPGSTSWYCPICKQYFSWDLPYHTVAVFCTDEQGKLSRTRRVFRNV